MSSKPRGTHRQALLEAAKILLRTRGYGHITARDLVAASSTNLGSIGYHFGSMEALLNEAISEALAEWATTIARAAEAEPGEDPLERVASTAGAMLDQFEYIRPYFIAFLEALSHSARSPELARQLAEHYQQQRQRVAGSLRAALGDGLDERAAARLAVFMIAVTDGLLLQYYADPERMPTGAELSDAARAALAAAIDPAPVRKR
jgi:AcrR family transcriptional regulator